MIKKEKPKFDLVKPPANKFRLYIYNFIRYWAFDAVIMVLIILNILTMAMEFEG